MLAAFIDALQTNFNRKIEFVYYDEHALSSGTDAKVACYIQLNDNGSSKTGIAFHLDIISASLDAILKSIS